MSALRRPVAALAVLLALTLPARAEDVVIFAAASLKTALDRIAADVPVPGARLVLSYAGTPALARQIELGAPAHLFIAASADWMDYLGDRDLIQPETRVDLLGNDLVLVRHGPGPGPVTLGPGFDLAAELGEGRLAMALVDAVPAGIYGQAGLRALGLWDIAAPRVAQSDNVRAALALVALGEAPLGIVYASDALAEPRVSIAARFPPGSHPPIVYPAALVAGRATPAARAALDALQGAAARAIFAEAGFRPLPE